MTLTLRKNGHKQDTQVGTALCINQEEEKHRTPEGKMEGPTLP
jgi:hypothetical protein